MANRSKFALLKTPMETSGDWRGCKPQQKQGNGHSEGHVNFFTPKTYLKLLETSGLEVIADKLFFNS